MFTAKLSRRANGGLTDRAHDACQLALLNIEKFHPALNVRGENPDRFLCGLIADVIRSHEVSFFRPFGDPLARVSLGSRIKATLGRNRDFVEVEGREKVEEITGRIMQLTREAVEGIGSRGGFER